MHAKQCRDSDSGSGNPNLSQPITSYMLSLGLNKEPRIPCLGLCFAGRQRMVCRIQMTRCRQNTMFAAFDMHIHLISVVCCCK